MTISFASIKYKAIMAYVKRLHNKFAYMDPYELKEMGLKSIRKIIAKTHAEVPGYKELLDRSGIKVEDIVSYDDFRKLPLITKLNWFNNPLRDICSKNQFANIATFYSSSGSGNTNYFSYGSETHEQRVLGAFYFDFLLEKEFGLLSQKGIVINSLAMGVRVILQKIPCVDTSVREDVIQILLRKLSAEFNRFCILGDHVFLKHVVENSLASTEKPGLDELKINIVTGSEYIAENYRTYMAGLLKMDLANPNSHKLLIGYGLSEVSTLIGWENWPLIQIRRLMHENEELFKSLCGAAPLYAPLILQYNPLYVHLETVVTEGREEIVATTLDSMRAMPLIRYNTFDVGKIIEYDKFVDILRQFGYDKFIPPEKFPILLLWGKCQGLAFDGGMIYPEQIKQALYAESGIAGSVTANFRLKMADGKPSLLVQIKDGVEAPPDMVKSLTKYIRKYSGHEISLQLIKYRDFPFGIRHDFERKNKYL